MSAAALRLRAASGAPDTAVLGGLALATALCTTWAAIAAGWNTGMSLALATTAIAVVEATLLASSTAGRLTAAVAAPLLGLLVIVPTTLGGLPLPDAGESGGLRHVVREYAGAFGGGLLGDGSWAFIVGFCGGMWVCGFFGAWMAVRERRGFFAVLPLYGILASNAINAPLLGAVVVPSLAAMGFSFVLLSRTTLAFLEQRWRGDRVVALPGTRRRYARIALVAAAGVTLLAALLPPLTSTDISGRLFPFNVNGGHGGTGGRATGPGGAAQASIRFSPDTIPGGPLVENPQPVLSYTVDSGDTVYLRVIDDTVFQAGNWFPSERQRDLLKVPVASGQIPRDRDLADGGVSAVTTPQRAHVIFAANVTTVGNIAQVPFPGEPEAVDRSVTALGDASSSGQLLTVDHVDLPAGAPAQSTLTVTATQPAATEAQLRSAGTAYPGWIDQYGYRSHDVASGADRLQLQAITSLAQSWTRGLTNAYDEARAVESHLRSAPFVYTLSPPPAPAGEWPIYSFLIDNHRGYCQYFASSMGTMLRALGIPARLVTGYGPGSVDDTARAGTTQLRRVTTSDAHVWVEAYFPQYGWIPFEPTPSSTDGDYEPIPRPAPAQATPTPSPSGAPATPTPAPTAKPTPAAAAGTTGSANLVAPPPALLALVGGLLGLGIAVALALGWMVRPPTLRALWTRMGILAALLGTRRRPAETLGAFCARLGDSLPAEARGHRDWRMTRERALSDLDIIGALSGKAAFSRTGLRPAEVTRWRSAWRGLVRLMPRLLLRRLVRRGHGEEPAAGTAPVAPV